MGTYVVAHIASGDVAGMMAQPSELLAAGVPPCWSVFVAVDDADIAVSKAVELGGVLLQPPITIPGGARVASIADPGGAALALMQAPASNEVLVRNDVGAVCWVECMSREPEATRRFVEDLFGWKGEDGEGGYVVLHHDGERVGGLMPMPASVPAGVPSHWLVYFAVDDVGDASVRVAEAGGSVLVPARAIAEGRFAICADPDGAVFACFDQKGTRH